MSIGRLVALALLVVAPSPAFASIFSTRVCADPAAPVAVASTADRIWDVRFDTQAPPAPRASLVAAFATVATAPDGQGSPRAKAVEYSHGYEVRMKVHKIASLATLPLFATEYFLGQKLYDGTSNDSVKGAHGAVAGAIAGLFGVNTVTGVWNLWEARHDTNRRGRRIAHAIMMLGADAGFVATGMLAPDDDDPNNYLDRRSTHRTVALTSMAVATASYLMMLFWK
jgi:hypothetical protein